MKLDLITLSVPIFFASILVEAGINRVVKKRYYVLGDSLASIGTGTLDQLLIAITRAFIFTPPYLWLYYHIARTRHEHFTWPLFFLGLLVADFFYYWAHRWSHEVNVLWAGHVIHHQSEEYNLSTALRQNWFSSWFQYLFDLPLAVMGFGPPLAAAIIPVIQLYQFWIHTRLIGKLGPLEWVLNTPSHHRVHHGINPQYVDKNYGAILIIWDRIFGTYAEEKEAPLYGVLKPLKSWNPVWAYISPWKDLVVARDWRVWLKHPGWTPGVKGVPNLKALYQDARKNRFSPVIKPARYALPFIYFVLILGSSSLFLFSYPKLKALQGYGIAAFLIANLALFGVWMERLSAQALARK